jgi:1,4-dihydroxy-2-naphthoate octaprenyltransferase
MSEQKLTEQSITEVALCSRNEGFFMRILGSKSLKFWFDASRKTALGQSLTPYILGVLLALTTAFKGGLAGVGKDFNVLMAVLGFVGVALAHSGLNLLDDYFDYTGGAVAKRRELKDGGMRARMGKCAYFEAGNVTPQDTRRVAILFIAAALVLGAVVLVVRGWPVVVFALVALVLGVLYAGPPLRLSYHGLGELIVGLIFGPLVVIAAYFITIGHIDPIAVWASIPAGLLTINILNTHSIMDFEPDKAAHRTTLVVLLGSKRAGFVCNVLLLVLSYASVIAAVCLGVFSPYALVVLLTIPIAVAFLRLVYLYITDPDAPVAFKPWMGPVGNADRFEAAGITWFMVRWLLARNLLMAFVLLEAIGNFFRP